MKLYHGCGFKKASEFKGLTIGVVDNKNRGIVAPGKVQKILTLSEFIELTKEDEKKVVYGVKHEYFSYNQTVILKPLYCKKDLAIKALEEYVKEKNKYAHGIFDVKKSEAQENTYYNGEDLISIEEFEVI